MESFFFFLFSYSLVFLFFLLFFSTFLWFFGLAGQRTKEYSLSAHFLPSGDEVRTQRKQKRRMIFTKSFVLSFCCVTITGHTTKGYSLYFDLTGQNTKKQDKEPKKAEKKKEKRCPSMYTTLSKI